MKKSTYIAILSTTAFFSSIITYLCGYLLFSEANADLLYFNYYPTFMTVTIGILIMVFYIAILIRCCVPIYRAYRLKDKGDIRYRKNLKYVIFLGIYPIIAYFIAIITFWSEGW